MKDLNTVTFKEEDGHLKIEAEAGASKAEALKLFLQHKLSPALFLTGLPGDIGGGVVMNAGVGESFSPREFGEIISWVEVLKPDEEKGSRWVTLSKEDLEFSYRSSRGWQPGVITKVGLQWSLEPDLEIMKKMKEATRARLRKQPIDKSSCGSTFKNPPGNSAGALIDQCGLKGHQYGGAHISLKHANFIVSEDSATAEDVHTLIEYVKKTVREKTGVELDTEVVYLGRWERNH